MNRELIKNIMLVVQAKINLAREEDRGRDTTHEYIVLNEAEKQLDEYLGGEISAERDPENGLDFLLVNMDKVLPGWFVQNLSEYRTQIVNRGDRHEICKDPMKRWICQVQKDTGGLLTTGFGRTPVGAFNRAVDAARAYHVGD